MALGPIEVVVLGFPGSQFTGEIRPRIVELVESGTITMVDALFIQKDQDGTVTYLEMEELADHPDFESLESELSAHIDLISGEDADEFAADLEPGSSAVALVFEHTWMKPVRDAVVASGGVLLADIHVPADVVDEVLAAVERA